MERFKLKVLKNIFQKMEEQTLKYAPDHQMKGVTLFIPALMKMITQESRSRFAFVMMQKTLTDTSVFIFHFN